MITEHIVNVGLSTFLPYCAFSIFFLQSVTDRHLVSAGIKVAMPFEVVKAIINTQLHSGIASTTFHPILEGLLCAVNLASLACMYMMYNEQHRVTTKRLYSTTLKNSVAFATGYTLVQAIVSFLITVFSTEVTREANLNSAAARAAMNLCHVPVILCAFSAIYHGSYIWKWLAARDLLNYIVLDSLIRYLMSYHYEAYFGTTLGKVLGTWGSEVALRLLVIIQAAVVSYFGIISGKGSGVNKEE